MQNLWSAAVTPKGAFFCEIAAALDMLYDGPGGWPIEPGWWKRTPAEFGDQLRWCELCAAPLDVPRVQANQEIDIVSPVHVAKLRALGAPSLQRNRVMVLDPSQYRAGDFQCSPTADWYIQGRNDQRAPAVHESLRTRQLDAVVVCVDYGDMLRWTLPYNRSHFNRFVIVTASGDAQTQRIARQCAATLVISDRCHDNGDAFNKGKMLNDGLAALDNPQWIVFTDADVFLPQRLGPTLRSMVLNPGCLYFTRRRHLPDANGATIIDFLQRGLNQNPLATGPAPVDDAPAGFFQLWNPNARAIGGRWPKVLSEEFPSAASIDSWFHCQWALDKVISLASSGVPLDVVHIPHGEIGQNWNGRLKAAREGWRFGGHITPERVLIVQEWPEDAELKVIGVNIEGSVLINAWDLKKRISVDGQQLLMDGRPLGYVLLSIAWRPRGGNRQI